MQFSQFKNFLGRTMKPGQGKTGLLFLRVVEKGKKN